VSEGKIEMIVALIISMIRARLRLAPRSQNGQIVFMAAAMTVCITGGIALAIDVGRAYEQRQAMENMAQSGARAGALETYRLSASTTHSNADDSRVLYSIYQAIATAGGTVRNVTWAGTDS
jgi:Flp pilus assembly protein TadG